MSAPRTGLAAVTEEGSGEDLGFSNWFLKALEGGKGIQWLRASADGGNVESQYNVGRMCLTGEGLAKDPKQAEKYLRVAADQGHPDACFLLSKLLFGAEGRQQDMKEASKYLERAAIKGHTKAQCNLGVMYSRGYGVTTSRKMAERFFTLAAEDGHVDSQYNLGMYLADEEGDYKPTPEDIQRAADWFAKAAMKGHKQAPWRLFLLYIRGDGVTQSSSDAHHWLKIAGKNGHTRALFELATLARTGELSYGGWCEPITAKVDEQAALRMYTEAARAGHPQAMCNLGVMYYEGMGLREPNVDAGMHWLTKAADANVGVAQYELGHLHREAGNIQASLKWFHRAASAGGHGGAGYEIGLMYLQGVGVLQDYAKAKEYLERAAEDGHEGAQFLLETNGVLGKVEAARGVGAPTVTPEEVLVAKYSVSHKDLAAAAATAQRPATMPLGARGLVSAAKTASPPPAAGGGGAPPVFDRPGRRLMFAGSEVVKAPVGVRDLITVRHGLLQPVNLALSARGTKAG